MWFVQITRVFDFKTCTLRKDAKATTTLRKQRNTLHCYAFQLPSKLTMKVKQTNAEERCKIRKMLCNPKGEEMHLCGDTSNAPQAQETQNENTATLCSGFFMSKRVLA